MHIRTADTAGIVAGDACGTDGVMATRRLDAPVRVMWGVVRESHHRAAKGCSVK